MIGITNAGGGKDRLNLRVFGGTTDPSNPKNNDIWVKTSIAIPNYSVFINEATSNFWTGPANGSIYIPFEASNSGVTQITGANIITHGLNSNLQEFNVNFLGCKQIMNGVWANVEAYVYHNGWHLFSSTYNGELFYQGNQFTDVTGGWNPTNARMHPWNEGWDMVAPTMEIGTNMVVYQASNVHFGTIFTRNKIDVSKYKALKADVQYDLKGPGFNNGFWLGVSTSNGDQYRDVASFMAQTDHGNKAYNGVITIDLSNVYGSVYVYIAVVRHTHVSNFGTNPVTFRKIWLE